MNPESENKQIDKTIFHKNFMMNIPQTAHCRLCAELKPRNKLSHLDTDETKCREIIQKLNRVNVKTNFDGNIFPKTVCFVCIDSLERAYKFVTAVERAQAALDDILLSQDVKKECSDSDSDDLIVYDVSEVKYEDNIESKIKIEVEAPTNDLVPSSNKSRTSSKGKKKRSLSFSLDSIPLAQLKQTWSEYNWLCSFCGVQFPTVDELREHSMKYHRSCNAYRCTDCNFRKLRFDKFLIHIKRHKKHLKFSCYKCYRVFSTPHKTNIHIKKYNKTEFVCPGCNTNFLSFDQLKEHTEVFYYQMRKEDGVQIDSNDLTCLICKKEFTKIGSMKSHMLTHTDRTRDFVCEICGKGFFNKHILADHIMGQHSNVRPHKCEICKLSFRTIHQLRKHVGVHDGIKPFSCEQCGKCFRLHKQLMSHQIIHTDSLPHVCTYCNKGFRFKSILNQHVRQHTGVKPYSCTLCQRDFTNWPNYNKHMKRKHCMDMAKKKHTPDGLFPIDPKTGEVIYPMDKMEEWKEKVLQPMRLGRKRVANGRGLPVEKFKEKNNN